MKPSEAFKKKWAGQDIPCDKCGNYNHRIAFDDNLNITFRCLNCGKVTTLHHLEAMNDE